LGELEIKEQIIGIMTDDQKLLLNRIKVLKLKNTTIVAGAGAIILGMGYLIVK